MPESIMRWYALTTFLSAFLLFQVQPLVGKSILPWFGGTPSVWTTCMLFFQSMLLAGYGYAHLVVRGLSAKRQGQLHATLLFISVALLPIIPDSAFKPTDGSDPTWRILTLLLFTVGGPYVLLSATAPLLQSWFHRAHRLSPFRLYALSNVASLLALITYPLVVERVLRLQVQAWAWSISYVLFALTCGILALRLQDPVGEDFVSHEPEPEDDSSVALGPSLGDGLMWLWLAMCGSMILLSMTNHLTQDVAAVPFLWVLPLAIYLLSFVICFDAEQWYRRSWFNVLLIISILLASLAAWRKDLFSLPGVVAAYAFVLFVCCMTCHGELVRLKPSPRFLTAFYLVVALGGALGGVFVTFVAPVVFTDYVELPISLMLTCLAAIVVKRYERYLESLKGGKESKMPWKLPACGMALVILVGANRMQIDSSFPSGDGDIERRRNFYGALLVRRESSASPEFERIAMSHGTTTHGFQFQHAAKRNLPTSYYVLDSGVGLALTRHPRRLDQRSMRVGVIGLGCGTLSAYMNVGDYLCFYEINPDVVELSEKYFTFQKDAIARGVDLDVFLGDARIVMENQLRTVQSQDFDVLVVDAFSSDAIPIHLLTKECFEVYWQHLDAEGILAIHISNSYLDLFPVVSTLAESYGKSVRMIRYRGETRLTKTSHHSDWVLCTTNQRFLSSEQVAAAGTPAPNSRIEWTDDFSSLYGVLRD